MIDMTASFRVKRLCIDQEKLHFYWKSWTGISSVLVMSSRKAGHLETVALCSYPQLLQDVGLVHNWSSRPLNHNFSTSDCAYNRLLYVQIDWSYSSEKFWMSSMRWFWVWKYGNDHCLWVNRWNLLRCQSFRPQINVGCCLILFLWSHDCISVELFPWLKRNYNSVVQTTLMYNDTT